MTRCKIIFSYYYEKEQPFVFVRVGAYSYTAHLNRYDELVVNFEDKLTAYDLHRVARSWGLHPARNNPKADPINPFYLP